MGGVMNLGLGENYPRMGHNMWHSVDFEMAIAILTTLKTDWL